MISSSRPRRSLGSGWREARAIGMASRPAKTVRNRPTCRGSRSATARRVATGVAPQMIMISPAVTIGARELRAGAMRTGALRSLEADGAAVDLEQGFLLLAVGGVHFAEAHDLAHHLRIESAALGLGVDLADIGGETRLLLFQPLDALEERAQAICRDAAGLLHDSSPPPRTRDNIGASGRPQPCHRCCLGAAGLLR